MCGFGKTWRFDFGFWEIIGGLFGKEFGSLGLLANGLLGGSGFVVIKLLFNLAGVLNCLNCFCLVDVLTWNAGLAVCEVVTGAAFCPTGFGFDRRETGGGPFKSSG